MKVWFAQSCPTLCDPMDYYPTSLFCPWNSPGKNPGVGSHSLLQRIFLSQGSNPGLPHCRQGILLQMQGTQIQSLVWRDYTCHRAIKPMWPWAHALGPAGRNYWAWRVKSLCSPTTEATTTRSPHTAKTQGNHKIKWINKFKSLKQAHTNSRISCCKDIQLNAPGSSSQCEPPL